MKKVISLLLSITILFLTFSPYMVLAEDNTRAEIETLNEYIINNPGIQYELKDQKILESLLNIIVKSNKYKKLIDGKKDFSVEFLRAAFIGKTLNKFDVYGIVLNDKNNDTTIVAQIDLSRSKVLDVIVVQKQDNPDELIYSKLVNGQIIKYSQSELEVIAKDINNDDVNQSCKDNSDFSTLGECSGYTLMCGVSWVFACSIFGSALGGPVICSLISVFACWLAPTHCN